MFYDNFMLIYVNITELNWNGNWNENWNGTMPRQILNIDNLRYLNGKI